MALVVRLTGQPAWLATVLLPLAVWLPRSRATERRAGMWPMAVPYGMAVLRVALSLVSQAAHAAERGVPEPWASLLDLNLAMAVAAGWCLLAVVLTRATLARAMLAGTLAWASVAYIGKRTHGVTASDPFAYAQMAVDLARHGTPAHVFPLAALAQSVGISTWPVTPVGYGLPHPDSLAAVSVWPPGYSVFLAAAYRLAGESGLYLLTPVLGVCAVLATWWTARLVLSRTNVWWRDLAASCAALVLATSFEQVDRLLVPLADIPAQLLTVLSVGCALRAARGSDRAVPFALASGACLGLAFTVRYTQVLIAAVLVVFWIGASRQRTTAHAVTGLVVTAIAAWLTVLPLLVYHAASFGSPLAVESSELTLFAWSNVGDSLAGTLGDLLRLNEFVLLAPFVVVGAVWLWRTARTDLIALTVWIVVIVGFHLPYAALRTRDVLSIFPALALPTGVGMAIVVAAVRGREIGWMRLGSVLVLLGPLWLRSAPTLEMLGVGARYTGFGYLQADQRSAFDTLKDLAPATSVIAATLNAGPIGLYADREAVRPADWSSEEWLRLADSVLSSGRRLFVLADGDEIERPLQDVRAVYAVQPRGRIPLPYFSRDAGSRDRDITVYEVEPVRGDRSSPRSGLGDDPVAV